MIQLPETLDRNKFTYLLIILLLNILFLPALISFRLEEFPHIGLILSSAAFTLLMLFAIVFTSHNRFIIIIAIAIILPNLFLIWLKIGVEQVEWHILLRNILDVAFLGLVAVLIIKYIFSTNRITFDYINAALCVYLILGLLWVSLYDIAEIIEPGSFVLPNDGLTNFDGHENRGDVVIRKVYFSFVTLLTLGYGDVSPINSIARLLAIIEALIGQIFLVVLVARLVGIHVAQSLDK